MMSQKSLQTLRCFCQLITCLLCCRQVKVVSEQMSPLSPTSWHPETTCSCRSCSRYTSRSVSGVTLIISDTVDHLTRLGLQSLLQLNCGSLEIYKACVCVSSALWNWNPGCHWKWDIWDSEKVLQSSGLVKKNTH